MQVTLITSGTQLTFSTSEVLFFRACPPLLSSPTLPTSPSGHLPSHSQLVIIWNRRCFMVCYIYWMVLCFMSLFKKIDEWNVFHRLLYFGLKLFSPAAPYFLLSLSPSLFCSLSPPPSSLPSSTWASPQCFWGRTLDFHLCPHLGFGYLIS